MWHVTELPMYLPNFVDTAKRSKASKLKSISSEVAVIPGSIEMLSEPPLKVTTVSVETSISGLPAYKSFAMCTLSSSRGMFPYWFEKVRRILSPAIDALITCRHVFSLRLGSVGI